MSQGQDIKAQQGRLSILSMANSKGGPNPFTKSRRQSLIETILLKYHVVYTLHRSH